MYLISSTGHTVQTQLCLNRIDEAENRPLAECEGTEDDLILFALKVNRSRSKEVAFEKKKLLPSTNPVEERKKTKHISILQSAAVKRTSHVPRHMLLPQCDTKRANQYDTT